MKVYILLVLLAVSSIDGSVFDFCNKRKPQPDDPKKPVMNYSYMAEIVIKTLTTKSVRSIKQNYDAKQNNRSYFGMTNGYEYGQIWNADSGVGVSFREGTCKQINLTQKVGNEDFGLETIFSLNGTWNWEGTSEIRGVQVNCWSNCFGEYLELSYKASYCFTVQDNTPFRFLFKGTSGTFSSEQICDYFKFIKKRPDSNSMKPPPGVYCPSDVAYPDPLPSSATYRAVEVEPNAKMVKESKITYDKPRQVYKAYVGNSTIYRDYSRGIQFQIQNGVCKRSIINRIGRPDQVVGPHGNVHMANLDHFLIDSGNFTYNGETKVRNIPCKIYSKTGRSAEEYGGSTTVELYFAKDNVKIYNDNGALKSAANPVVRAVFKGGKPLRVIKQFEIYDFDAEETPLSYPYNLEKCYNDLRKTRFRMTLQATGASLNYYGRQELLTGLTMAISKALNIPFLRVQPIKASEIENNQYLFIGELFDKETVTAQFTEQINTYQPITSKKGYYFYQSSSNTPTICAEYCVNETSRPFSGKEYCRSFMFNRATKACTFIYQYNFLKKTQPNNIVDFYKRTYAKQRDYLSLRTAWMNLQKAVSNGKITYQDPKDSSKVFKAVSVETETKPNNFQAPQTTSLSRFTPLDDDHKLVGTPVEIFDKISITAYACATRCLNSLRYYCKAFSYHRSSLGTMCKFYDQSSYRKLNSYDKNQQEENHMQVKSMIRNLFDGFLEIPGQTLLSANTDYVYTAVDGKGCAELCIRNTQIFCQSFEVCGDVCLLGNTHFYDAPKANIQTKKNCTHYSRMYLQDYSRVLDKNALVDDGVIEMKDVGVRECAKLCSTSPDYDCNVFEYCDMDSTCRVSTKTVKNIASLAFQKTGKCDLYSRKPGAHRAINVASKMTSTNAGGHSAGSMGGVAFGMILLGCFLIMVVGLIVMKMRTPGGSGGPSIGFSRNKLEEDE